MFCFRPHWLKNDLKFEHTTCLCSYEGNEWYKTFNIQVHGILINQNNGLSKKKVFIVF